MAREVASSLAVRCPRLIYWKNHFVRNAIDKWMVCIWCHSKRVAFYPPMPRNILMHLLASHWGGVGRVPTTLFNIIACHILMATISIQFQINFGLQQLFLFFTVVFIDIRILERVSFGRLDSYSAANLSIYESQHCYAYADAAAQLSRIECFYFFISSIIHFDRVRYLHDNRARTARQ